MDAAFYFQHIVLAYYSIRLACATLLALAYIACLLLHLQHRVYVNKERAHMVRPFSILISTAIMNPDYFSFRSITTRRFLARPAAVLLLAAGVVSP